MGDHRIRRVRRGGYLGVAAEFGSLGAVIEEALQRRRERLAAPLVAGSKRVRVTGTIS